MILERLSVAGFRTFAQRLDFTADERFTVIHAPNGTGKSTLLDALYYGLLERHGVSGDGAKQRFQSIGRDLTPTIEIDFAVDRERYRLRKVFLTSAKSASLQRRESGRYVAFKDAGAADDFVRDLFFAEAPGRGAIEPTRHLGFAHVLWSPARAGFGDLPGVAGDQVRAFLGGSALAVTDGERMVQERVTSEYQRFFTDEGNYTTRVGSANVPGLEAGLKLAREAEVEARAQYLRLEHLNVANTDREAEAGRMNTVRGRLRAEIERMRADVAIYAGLHASSDRATRIEADARTAYEGVSSAIRSLTALRAERDVLRRSRAEAANELKELGALAAVLHGRYSFARKAFEDAVAAVGEVQGRAGCVTAARSYLDSCERLERLQADSAAYDAATAEVAEIATAQADEPAPAPQELESLRESAAEFNSLQATIAASALCLEIDADSDVTIAVVAGEKVGPLHIAGGTTTKIAAAQDSVVIDLPGVGRIRAHGTDGAARARKKLQPIAAKLEAVWRRYGACTIPELAARTERAQDRKRSAAQAQTRLAAVLNGRTIADLRESIAEERSRISSLEGEHPDWRAARPDAQPLRARFDRDLQQATDASRLARLELDAVEHPTTEVDANIAVLKTLEAGFAIKLEANAAQVASIEGDGRDDDARAGQERTLVMTWSAARSEVTVIGEKLARFVEDPRIALDGLEAAERDAGTAYEAALGEAKACRAQLEMQANLGSYAKLVAAEEHVAQCESVLAGAKAQASAIASLHGAFGRIRAGRVASVIGPITAASTRYLTRIVGSPMGQIEIGEGLTPSGLIEKAFGRKLAIDGTLSTGEKEQIYLATRLALAEVIAKDRGRQLFVVDDAMTATDPNRLRRFVGILEELSREHLQVIVTTADRSRYLGISGAKHVDLAATLVAESAA